MAAAVNGHDHLGLGSLGHEVLGSGRDVLVGLTEHEEARVPLRDAESGFRRTDRVEEAMAVTHIPSRPSAQPADTPMPARSRTAGRDHLPSTGDPRMVVRT
ncbi:hypothetical protein [Streptomyces sp. LUP47B]|uniref:hypothetical protein n=1 Tax=Streptomyces sp. LUP47B TaxID=1890286 RepID=UPI00159F31C1|nr:hypothetical protein [Streptomyces sp. LUP47B]